MYYKVFSMIFGYIVENTNVCRVFTTTRSEPEIHSQAAVDAQHSTKVSQLDIIQSSVGLDSYELVPRRAGLVLRFSA